MSFSFSNEIQLLERHEAIVTCIACMHQINDPLPIVLTRPLVKTSYIFLYLYMYTCMYLDRDLYTAYKICSILKSELRDNPFLVVYTSSGIKLPIGVDRQCACYQTVFDLMSLTVLAAQAFPIRHHQKAYAPIAEPSHCLVAPRFSLLARLIVLSGMVIMIGTHSIYIFSTHRIPIWLIHLCTKIHLKVLMSAN